MPAASIDRIYPPMEMRRCWLLLLLLLLRCPVLVLRRPLFAETSACGRPSAESSRQGSPPLMGSLALQLNVVC